MNIHRNALNFLGRKILLSLLLSAVFVHSAWSAHVPITAKFTPNPSNPRVNSFVNTTPVTGYCAQTSVNCTLTNTFSIRVNTNFTDKPIKKGEAVSIKVPWVWRKLTVNHPVAGPQEVEVRIVGVGSTYTLSAPVATLVDGKEGETLPQMHGKLWAGTRSTWIYAPAPCSYSGVSHVNMSNYTFFWKVTGQDPCTKTAAYDIPGFGFRTLDFAYELRTPNPLAMHSGTYTGSLAYTVGPNGDFDINHQVANDDSIVLDFSLEVVHALKVEIPPGGHKVELIPEGGWARWLDSGKTPPRLFRDQPFLISSSTPFKMYVECEGVSGRYCYLNNATMTSPVPVEVSVTLPSGFSDNSGAPINRRALSHITGMSSASSGAALQVRPGYYVNRASSILHFEVPKEGIAELLSKDVSTHYSGRITVIWDADI